MSSEVTPRITPDGAVNVSFSRGSRLGLYTIDGIIAATGQSQVYSARRGTEPAPYAIKVYNDRYSQADFDNEVAVHRRVGGHENIVSFRDAGQFHGRQYIVTDRAAQSLKRRVELEGALSAADAVSVTDQTANALMMVHGKGLVHADVKPGNILLAESGVVWLNDFGLAAKSPKILRGRDRLKFTAPYAAPEQLEGFAAESTDTYALALVSYLLATGETFFNVDDQSRINLHFPIMYELFKREQLRDVGPKPLQDLFYSALHVDPDQRPENPRRFAEEFALAA